MITKQINRLKAWRNGADGFFQFLEDVELQVPSSKGGYETYIPGDRKKEEIRKALQGDYRTAVFCWPRRDMVRPSQAL